MKSNTTLKVWRVILALLAFVYIISLILFVYLVKEIPDGYNKALIKDNEKIERKIKKVLDKPNLKDFENLESNNKVEFVITNKKDIVYSTIPKSGIMDYKKAIEDNKQASEIFFQYKDYNVWIVNSYISPQKVFNDWILIMFGLLMFMISIVLITIVIVYRKFVYPFKRLKENIKRLANHQLKLNDESSLSEYDALSKELYSFAFDLDRYLERSTVSYTALEEKLQENNEALEYQTTVISGMVHDLKSPINTIKLLSEELENKVDLSQVKSIGNISSRALNKINEIGKVRINTKLLEEKENIDIISELMYVYKEHKEIFDMRGLFVDFYLDEDIELFVNKIKYRQLLNNIMSNISNYAKANGVVEFSCYLDDNNVTLYFYNDANKLTEEQLENIFELGYRISDDKIGSGTGLYTIKRLVSEMSGQVDIYNKDNGVELKVTLKRNDNGAKKSI